MGEELANSDQFARCQVEKVFKTVCLRPPVDQPDRDAGERHHQPVQGGGYQMKDVFAQTAAYCKGN